MINSTYQSLQHAGLQAKYPAALGGAGCICGGRVIHAGGSPVSAGEGYVYAGECSVSAGEGPAAPGERPVHAGGGSAAAGEGVCNGREINTPLLLVGFIVFG